MFKVKFVVHTKISPGTYQIRVVGNLPILGSWNPLNGLEMQQYDEGQWQSTKHIEIPNGQQFQFKLVKVEMNNAVQWQQLPNNSNRKFKPKFHTKLILNWSSHIGKGLNLARSSMKMKGLPGVMVNGHKQAGMLKRNPINKKRHVLDDSQSSQNQNENDSFCVGRKKSTDIRESIDGSDIEQIYYETTQLQNAYHTYKQIQINLVSGKLKENSEFVEKIDEQLKELHQLQNFKFKWIILGDDDDQQTKLHKKISFVKIQNKNQQKINLQSCTSKNFQKNHYIFLDLDAALKTQIGNSSACLYLSQNQFQKASNFLEDLQKFQFICFDNPQANRQLLKIYEEKKYEVSKQKQKQKQKQEQSLLTPQKIQNKRESSKSQKSTQAISLQRIIEQLQICCQSETNINTFTCFTKIEASQRILQQNSILFIDSEIMKTQKKFFECLLNPKCQKRLIIIIHKGPASQWIHNYAHSKNVCVVLQNFSKLYFVGKMYEPSKKHEEVMAYIQMTAKLFQKKFGGSWKLDQNCFIYKFKQGTIQKASSMKTQVENYIMKKHNYFKLSVKEDKLKISWNLSHPVRLLRTLIRIKSIEQGKIGNFFTVSQNQNFNELKQQIKLLISTNHLLMEAGNDTKIEDFGFGASSCSKYTISNQGIQSRKPMVESSPLLPEYRNKKEKKRQFLEKCCDVDKF